MQYAKCGGVQYQVRLEPLGVPCSECRRQEAVVHLRYARKRLCATCFSDFFVRRVRRTVERYRMFGPRDRVAVAVSGGKDSVALLHALRRAFPEQDLVAMYLNLGIAYYSDHLEQKVRDLARRLEVPLVVHSLPRDEGYRMDDFLATRYRNKMCSVCGAIKRQLFSKLAREQGATVVATGHNLDDTVGTMLSAFFAGDFESIQRLKPVLPPLIPGQARKVKPLIHTPEIEDLYYVLLNRLPVQECSCPHGLGSSVHRYKDLLDQMEQQNPNVKHQLLAVFLKKFVPLVEQQQSREAEIPQVQPCVRCGEPTSSPDRVCSRCRRVEMLQQARRLRLEITPEEFLAWPEQEPRVLIDVRSPEEYEENALEGAIHLPADEVLAHPRRAARRLKAWRRSHTLVVYCNTGRTSYAVAVKLRNLGFRALNLQGGLEALRRTEFFERVARRLPVPGAGG